MQTYIALLRGINVSGQKKIKMADLRQQLEDLPYENIRTYIQSGNILFNRQTIEPSAIATEISGLIQKYYQFEVETFVYKPEDFQFICQNNPYEGEADKDITRTYLTFLKEIPDSDKVSAIEATDYTPEEFRILDTYLFFYSPQGYGRAKMNNNFFEKKLKIPATTRNWKTVNKLLEMSLA